MKMRLFSTLVSILVLSTASSLANSYTIGPLNNAIYYLIANQLNHAGGNSLPNLFSAGTLPDGTEILIPNCSSNNIYFSDSGSPSGWDDSNFIPLSPAAAAAITLNPGEAFFIVPSSTINSLTFTGNPVVPVLPATLPCGCGQTNYLSCQTNTIGTYENITGLTPQNGAEFMLWNGTGYTVYTYNNSSWTPSVPTAAIGEGVAIIVPCPTNCLQVQCPTNKTVQCGTNWAFDLPIVSTCCTNEIYTTAGTVTNVLIAPISLVTNGACSNLITQTWLITDGCGDSNTCSQTVTVLGCCPTNCLQVVCPTNKTVPCGSAWSFDQPTATTCCTSNVPGTATNLIITATGTVTNGVCPQVITQSWLITDGCGNTNTCSQTVTVVDTGQQVINLISGDNAGIGNQDPLTTFLGGAQMTALTGHGSGGVFNTIDFNNAAAGPSAYVVNSIFWLNPATTAPFDTDGAQWISSTNTSGGVNAPTALYAQRFTLTGSIPAGTATLTFSWAVDDSLGDPSFNPGPNTAGVYINGYALNIGYDADGGGNNFVTSVTATFPTTYLNSGANILYVYDRDTAGAAAGVIYAGTLTVPEPSLLTCATNKTVQCGTAWSFDAPTAYDACCSNVTITVVGIVTNSGGSCSNSYTETWLATDCCSNTATCSQTVTVVDTTPPVLICASNFTVSSGQAWSFTPPMASDACCSNVTVVVLGTTTNVSFNPCEINYTRTWQATDCCSNSTTCSQTVTVVPNGPCQVFRTGMSGNSTLPGNAIDPSFALLSQPAGGQATLPNAVVIYPANANANYGSLPDNSVSQWIGPDPFDNFTVQGEEPAGVYHYQLTFLLCCTNGAELNGQMVADNSAGVYLNGSQFVAIIPGFASWTPISVASGFVVGLNTLDIYLTNNSSSGDPGFSPTAFRAEVTNCTSGLTISCPSNMTVQCGSSWNSGWPTASSCCGSNNIILISSVTNGACPKYITNSWRIYDNCGDTDVCSQVVTVVDTTPPVINCPTNSVIVALNTNCQLVIPYISVSATDNCTPLCSLVYSQSPTNGTIVAGHSQLVTVTVTDLCGNSSHCLVNVIGVDKTGPVLSGPATLSVTNCLVPCVTNFFTVRDNCCPASSLKITQSPPCDSLLGPGIHSVTITATDCNGNTTTKVIPLNISGNESFLGVLYNTGISNNGSLLPNGAVDPHYSLGQVPAGNFGYTAPDAVVITNQWGWLELVHVSEWIAPTLPDINSCPSGYYTYTNQFVLPSTANASTASISGQWAADDGASMYFNGVLQGANTIPVLAYPYQQSGFNHWHPFTISSGFLPYPSKNTILFVVTNAAAYNPSPTGLRVEYTNALVNCYTCTPPAIVSMTGNQTLPLFSTAVFHVNASGTPPLTYQWYQNNVALVNNGQYSGVNTATLTITGINYANAGTYYVCISNPCGGLCSFTKQLTISTGWPWNWGWWNVAQLDNPLAASVGPDLVLAGPPALGLAAGTTEDFGLPNPGGQIVNVLDVAPLPAGASIQVPLIAPPGSNSVNSYTVIMDLYEPDTSLGTPSTLFQSISCCVSNLGSSGQDGVALTLDVTNNLHITGSAGGTPFDVASTVPMPVDAWNRVALVVDNPQDGSVATLSAYLNGLPIVPFCPCCFVLPYSATSINWATSPPTLFSVQTNAVAPNGEFYVSSIQFHDIALSSDMIAGIGSPDNGPAPANVTSAGSPPVLSATMSNGAINITWSGSPYVLQETTDLTSGDWIDSALSFTETGGTTGNIVTTAVVTPAPSAPSKFYRLIFSP